MEDQKNLTSWSIPKEEIEWRVHRAQQEMVARGMDALLVIQRIDLLYFSGTAQNGCVFIPAQGAPLLLVKKFYPRALEESPLDHIVQMQSVREIPEIIIDYMGKIPTRIGFEWDVMPVREFRFYERLFPEAKCVDGSPAIHTVRSTKSAWELAQMENAAQNSSLVFEFITKHMHPGDTDVEISSRAEVFARSIGHGAVLRIRDYQKSGLLLSHLSAAGTEGEKALEFPAVREGNCLVIEPRKTLIRGVPVALESRFFQNGYHMNEARIFSMGPLASAFEDKANVLMGLQQETIGEIKPGMRAGGLCHLYREKARALGLEPEAEPQGSTGGKMIGNGIGLELVEPPLIADGSPQVLKQGMVLSVFSETSLKDHGFMRIKDVVLVTETGSRTITRRPLQTFLVQ